MYIQIKIAFDASKFILGEAVDEVQCVNRQPLKWPYTIEKLKQS